MLKHAFLDRRLLYHGAIRRKIAKQDRQAAGLRIGIIQRTDNIVIQNLYPLQVLGERLSCGCHNSRIQVAALVKLGHNGHYAAGAVKVFDMMVPRRAYLAQVRCAQAYFVDHIEVELKTGLMGYRRKVKHGVR